jgi:hypothetical protein
MTQQLTLVSTTASLPTSQRRVNNNLLCYIQHSTVGAGDTRGRQEGRLHRSHREERARSIELARNHRVPSRVLRIVVLRHPRRVHDRRCIDSSARGGEGSKDRQREDGERL